MSPNEWHLRPNVWHPVWKSATWDSAVDRFRSIDDAFLAASAKEAHFASDFEKPVRSLRRVVDAVWRDGLAVIEAAEEAYPLSGAPPGRYGLGSVSSEKSQQVRARIARELATAHFDLSNGRIFQASHRVARARWLLERNGERAYHSLRRRSLG